jgi:phage gp45-like
MSSRNIRFGVIEEESKDAGPHKLVRVKADGKMMDLKIWEPYGVQGSPPKGSEVLIFAPDGDDGKAVGIAMPPASQRVDGQKPGELTYINHVAGQKVKMSANGNVDVECSGTYTIKAPKIVFDGECHLGGDGGLPASMKGTRDSAGHVDVSGLATKVFLT